MIKFLYKNSSQVFEFLSRFWIVSDAIEYFYQSKSGHKCISNLCKMYIWLLEYFVFPLNIIGVNVKNSVPSIESFEQIASKI